nr:hypothetical protein MACL_00000433 [Theileria orientalis]
MLFKSKKEYSPKDLQFWESFDDYTLDNPHAGDPRFLQSNYLNLCKLRYTLYCRCCRELGEDDPRCKYQYYRTELSCTQDFLDLVNKHREEEYAPLGSHMYRNKPKIFENIEWNTPELEESVSTEFLRIFEGLEAPAIKQSFIFGVNSVTEAIENNERLCMVILFRWNVPSVMIQHIPVTCKRRNIDYLTFSKAVKLSRLPFKNVTCMAVKGESCELFKSLIR